MKKVLALLLTFVLALGTLVGCGNAAEETNADSGNTGDVVYRTLDEIKESGTIRIGVFSDKIPLVMWMKTAITRDMMFTSQKGSHRI